MKMRMPLLIALGTLSGCTSSNLYFGPALPTCSGAGSAEKFAREACRTGAEYDIARKKAKRSLDEDPARKD
jgi:hypothetical protein